MKTTLALVGCGPRLEIALAGAQLPAPALIALAGPTPRSDLIMAAVDLLLTAAGIERGEIGAVLATRGPGSFTGVRVTLATAQGLALGLGVPARGVSSLLAQALRTDVPTVLAVQPARRGFVYAQRFTGHGNERTPVGEPTVLAIAALAGTSMPIIAPTGLELAAGTPLAPSLRSAAEALVAHTDLLGEDCPDTLTPIYLEPPPAAPSNRNLPPWPPSLKAS